LLKLVGFRSGAAAVDDLMRYFRQPPVVPARLDGLGSQELEDLRRLLQIRTAILAHTLPTNQATAGKVLMLVDNLERPVTDGVGKMSPLLLPSTGGLGLVPAPDVSEPLSAHGGVGCEPPSRDLLAEFASTGGVPGLAQCG
jgi:hypothetical protein